MRSAEAKRQAEALALQAKKDQRTEANRKKLAEAKSARQLKKQEAFSETQAKHRARHEELEVARKQLGEAIKDKNEHTEQVRMPACVADSAAPRELFPSPTFSSLPPLPTARHGSHRLSVAGCGCSGSRSVGR